MSEKDSYYTSLNDCGQKGWYTYKDSDKTEEVYTDNLVGYYSECDAFESYDCGEKFEDIGYIAHDGRGPHDFQPNEGSAAAESTPGNCSGPPDANCMGAPHRHICRRNNPFRSTIGDGWAECCNSNTKYNIGSKDCHPLLYKENDKSSQQCVDICMQDNKPYKNIKDEKNTTLQNDYLNGACHDILKTNNNQSDLREFCSKAPAWSDTTGPNASYTDICGCYYPDKYYSNLKKIISDKTKIPEDMLGPEKCMSSFCADSKFNDNTKCPSLNILTCINNVNFNGNMNDSGNININQTNNCKQIINDANKGGGSPGSPGSPGSSNNSTFRKTIQNFQTNHKTAFIIIIIVISLLLLLLIIGIIVAIKRKKLNNQMSSAFPQLEN